MPELRLPDGAVVKRLDRNALRRVFDNLIGSAVKYSEGDLTVTLDEDGNASFLNAAGGLDPVSVGRLFDRFYTVETGRTSTGIRSFCGFLDVSAAGMTAHRETIVRILSAMEKAGRKDEKTAYDKTVTAASPG